MVQIVFFLLRHSHIYSCLRRLYKFEACHNISIYQIVCAAYNSLQHLPRPSYLGYGSLLPQGLKGYQEILRNI